MAQARMDVNLILPFVKSTQDTFSSMLGMKVTRKNVYIKKGYRMFGVLTGIIGISGRVTGTCAVSLPADLAVQGVEQMLCEKVENGVNDVLVHDGVGEIINMIVGQARSLLAETQYRFEITLPTIISGAGHEVYNKTGTRCVVIVFETDAQRPFTLEVCVPDRAPAG